MGEIMCMLKCVLYFDLIIGVAGGIGVQAAFKSYSLIFLIGLSAASLSFLFSAYLFNNILIKKSLGKGVLAPYLNLAKVFIISIIGVLLFNNNINNVIAYVLGFTSHFLALMLYGVATLLSERK
jgi:ATP synthase protein I